LFAAYALVMLIEGGLLLATSAAHPYLADSGGMLLLTLFAMFAYRLLKTDSKLFRRFWIALAVAVITPFLIGPIFKYLLLVPLPYEGLVVEFLDKIRYGEF
jgi:hypothetical protein